MNEEKPRRIDGVFSKALGNETLLYWADGKAIHVLNRTARRIWELCDGQNTVQEIEKVIRAEFQLPDSQVDIAGDIEHSLQMFGAAGLLEQKDSQAEATVTSKL
jgi:hypothetical protein